MNPQPDAALSSASAANSVTQALARRIAQFNAWKKTASTELMRYNLWQHQRGYDQNGEHNQRLQSALRLLASDRLRLVLVGEFSRGKTELINALLGRYASTRLFPTRVGRTTMCPVELFCDPNAAPYLKLLPIDTRASDQPLQHFRNHPDAWFQVNLDIHSPDSMKQVFREVARTREVSAAEAQQLGFDLVFLEASLSQAGYVHIPAWRHALINLDHPLLKLGLSVIDTPGLNAPGLEADLTHDILPDAQGILYLLSVETGITASDFSYWVNQIRPIAQKNNIALFALLNKIDLLESDEEPVMESIDRLIRMTAHQFNIARTHVLPLSAKHGLKATLANDALRLRRSGFAHLEENLIKSVVDARERLLENDLIFPILEHIRALVSQLAAEAQALQAEYAQYAQYEKDIQQKYNTAQQHMSSEEQVLNQHLQDYRQGEQHIQANLSRLATLIGASRFESHLMRSRSVLGITPNLSTLGSAVSVMISGVRLDFRRLRTDIELLPAQAQRLREDLNLPHMDLPRLDVEHGLQQLAVFEQKYQDTRLGTENARAAFEDYFLPQLRAVYNDVEQQLQTWHQAVLAPLSARLQKEQQAFEQRRSSVQLVENALQQQHARIDLITARLPVIQQDGQFLQDLLFRLQAVDL